MGAWGYEWSQSDAGLEVVLDAAAACMKPIEKVNSIKSIDARRRWYERARGGAGTLAMLSDHVPIEYLQDAVTALRFIASDARFMGMDKSQLKATNAVNRDIGKLEAIIKAKRGRHRHELKAEYPNGKRTT
jgi:hypothetical protein